MTIFGAMRRLGLDMPASKHTPKARTVPVRVQLTLDLPARLAGALSDAAKRRGRSPNELARLLLDAVIRHGSVDSTLRNAAGPHITAAGRKSA